MKILVVGASGATGRLLVEQLLKRDHEVRAIIRPKSRALDNMARSEGLHLVRANLLDLDHDTLTEQARDCDAIASCLGHNMSFKGIFGPPHRLVTQATRRLCEAVRANRPPRPVRFVLMNTTGNRNRDLDERWSIPDGVVIGLLRAFLPPQKDNESAAEHLRTSVGPSNPVIEWVAVRPDSLVDEEKVTRYETHPSPTRGVIFHSGRTSRINVAHFMAGLSEGGETWERWKGKMPVLYNAEGP